MSDPEGDSLNAPTGAWCSLTQDRAFDYRRVAESQCTYRCVVLPDRLDSDLFGHRGPVSMHLQVRGAP